MYSRTSTSVCTVGPPLVSVQFEGTSIQMFYSGHHGDIEYSGTVSGVQLSPDCAERPI